MEDRDANEFAIVLAGYYRLIAGKNWVNYSRIRSYENSFGISSYF